MALTRALLASIDQLYARRKRLRLSDREKLKLPISRFLSRIRISESKFFNGSPCWEWKGAKSSRGYGQFKVFKHCKTGSHRFAYIYFVGDIPDGLDLDHLCSNPPCSSPLHLEPVTRSENQKRAYQRGRPVGRKKRPTHCPKGHAYTPENTAITKKSLYCRVCNRLSCNRYQARKRGALT